MRSFTILTGLVSLLGTAAAYSSSEIFESLRGIPQGWTKVGKPNPSSRVRLRIALEQLDHDAFEQALFSVSTPGHEKYGQHLKREEVKALVKPRDESTEAVLSWLTNSGVDNSDIENDGEWINFYASVAKMEMMLNTTFYHFTQDADKTHAKKLRTLRYSLPRSVSSHIRMIQPTTRFGQMKAERSALFRVEPAVKQGHVASASSLSTAELNVTACNSTITPDCLRALYSIGDYQADPTYGSLFGVCGYLKEYAKYDALNAFLEEYAPYAVSQNFSYVLINGGLDTQNDTVDDDGEANLDIQYATSLGFKNNITYFSTGGLGLLVPDLDDPDQADNSNEPYLDFLDYILNLPDDELPQTITTSYGEDEQSIPEAYARTVCDGFGQLGARGVSIVFSSGDTGVGSACQTNDGTNTTRFLPIFPAACPYVTSVGATVYVEPEQAIFFSSGGFSDRFARPSYQDDAVSEYLGILGDQWDGLYNSSGRGFPDVSAQGSDFHVFLQDGSGFEDVLVGGTSASAPTFAAVISLLNNARLSAGQSPLGFLNPWLYSAGKTGLTDIVQGGSRGCTGIDAYTGLAAPYVPYASWNATTGWDPVSGLGTPDFQKLLAISTPNSTLDHIRK